MLTPPLRRGGGRSPSSAGRPTVSPGLQGGSRGLRRRPQTLLDTTPKHVIQQRLNLGSQLPELSPSCTPAPPAAYGRKRVFPGLRG